jgi:hypothetical protein
MHTLSFSETGSPGSSLMNLLSKLRLSSVDDACPDMVVSFLAPMVELPPRSSPFSAPAQQRLNRVAMPSATSEDTVHTCKNSNDGCTFKHVFDECRKLSCGFGHVRFFACVPKSPVQCSRLDLTRTSQDAADFEAFTTGRKLLCWPAGGSEGLFLQKSFSRAWESQECWLQRD